MLRDVRFSLLPPAAGTTRSAPGGRSNGKTTPMTPLAADRYTGVTRGAVHRVAGTQRTAAVQPAAAAPINTTPPAPVKSRGVGPAKYLAAAGLAALVGGTMGAHAINTIASGVIGGAIAVTGLVLLIAALVWIGIRSAKTT